MNHSLYLGLEVLGSMLVLGTLPLMIELGLLTTAALFPPRRHTGRALQEVRKLTVVIPCYNEELLIGSCLESVLASAGSRADVLVVAHNCTDSTAAIASSFPGVRVVSYNDTKRGKGFALEHGFELAFAEEGCDAVLVIDADSVVSENLIPVVCSELAWSSVLQCRYEVRNATANWRTRVLKLALQGINVVRPLGRDRLGLSCGIFGNGFAIRKEVLSRVPYGAYSLVEDLEFHLALITAGYTVRFLDDVTVRGEMPVSHSGVLTQRSRWEGGRLKIFRLWAGKLLRGLLGGRAAYAEPLLELLCIPLAFVMVALGALTAIPNAFFHGYVAVALVIVSFHLYVAARVGPDFLSSLQAVVLSPFYVIWKLSMLTPIIRSSRSGAEWIRTKRGTSRE